MLASGVPDAVTTELYDVVEGNNVVAAPNIGSTVGPAMTAMDLPVGMRVLDVWMKMAWERQTFTLPSDLPSGATSGPIPYPLDWTNTPTTGADYAGSYNNNAVTAFHAQPPTASPIQGVATTSPVNGSVSVPPDAPLRIEFDAPMTRTGTLEMWRDAGTDTLVESFDLSTDGTWSEGDTVWMGVPALPYTLNHNRYIRGIGLQLADTTPLADWSDTDLWAFSSQVTHHAELPEGFRTPSAPKGGADAITINHDLDSNGDPASPAGSGTHFSITNRCGEAWLAQEITIILDRGETLMEPDLLHAVDQTTVKLYRPTTPQDLDAGVKSTLFDFNRNLRPNAGFAISPTSGTNVAGAMLPEG